MERRKGGRFLGIAAAAVLGAAGLAPIGTAQAADWYWIINTQSGLCMDNFARSEAVFQYWCNDQWNEHWTWDATNPTWILLRERDNDGVTQLCLQVSNTALGTPVRLRDCSRLTGWFAWQWIPSADYPGAWQLKLWNPGGSQFCVKPPYDSYEPSELFLWYCDDHPETLWYHDRRG